MRDESVILSIGPLGASYGEEELRLWRVERVEQLAGIVERANDT